MPFCKETKSLPGTSQERPAAVKKLEKINEKNQKEVTVKLNDEKTLHIVHLDSKTVKINGKIFRRELVDQYLKIHKQQEQQNGKKTENLLKKTIKQEPKSTDSLLRNRLTSQTPKNSEKSSNEEFLFNENHQNTKGIKFLQEEFKSNPTLQSILAEIATLQKEYNDLDANSLDKEVELMREKNNLPSMIDTDLFKGKNSKIETIVRPSTSQINKRLPKLVPMTKNNGSNKKLRSDHTPPSPSDRLIIDEEATSLRKASDSCCQLSKRHHFCDCQIAKLEPVASTSDLKITEVFTFSKKLSKCIRCSFQGSLEEVTKHVQSHFKKKKIVQCGNNVKIKTEPDDCILIDDDD